MLITAVGRATPERWYIHGTLRNRISTALPITGKSGFPGELQATSPAGSVSRNASTRSVSFSSAKTTALSRSRNSSPHPLEKHLPGEHQCPAGTGLRPQLLEDPPRFGLRAAELPAHRPGPPTPHPAAPRQREHPVSAASAGACGACHQPRPDHRVVNRPSRIDDKQALS